MFLMNCVVLISSHLVPHSLSLKLIGIGSEMWLRGKSIRSWCDGSSNQSFMVDPLSYFSLQPVHQRQWDGAYKIMLAVNQKE